MGFDDFFCDGCFLCKVFDGVNGSEIFGYKGNVGILCFLYMVLGVIYEFFKLEWDGSF